MSAAVAVFAGEEDAAAVMAGAVTGLGANDMSDLVWDGGALWVCGSGTLNRHLGGGDWRTFSGESGFGTGTIYALAAGDGIFLLSWGWTGEYNGSAATMGGGFSLSLDNGETWQLISVRELFPDRAAYAAPERYTATWDIAISDSTIWAATLSGFLLESADSGTTWTNILPNGGTLNLLNPNHHGQCVDAYGDTVWVGTFDGMNLSTDKGVTWQNFSWDDEDTVTVQPGDFVYAVEHKRAGGETHVWAGGSDYYGSGKYGIYHTDDNGATWQRKSTKYTAWNFAFGHAGASDPLVSDSTVFAASDSGLVVSYDLGETWDVMDIRQDAFLGWNRGSRVSSVAVVADTLWAVSTSGIARSADWGKTWTIYSGLTRVRTLDTGATDVGLGAMLDGVETYAYPNPISPLRNDANYSRAKIHYALTNDAQVTVTIYSFNRKLRTIVSGEARSGGREYDEVWDGRDESGRIVPNGAYFYIIKTSGGETARGKIVVLD